METEHKPKLRPDFNQWLETEDGLKCNNFGNLNEQKYLTNRLFWAFDAGRNCIWDQYLEIKKEREALQEENRRLNIQLSNYAYQIDRAKRDRDEAQFKVMELEKELERLKFNSQ